ncbi:chromosome-associated kinesin KIF4A-like [Chironomus tepperi]|uniref:chromosome-associated kinesin KIF4A-like n=1 Tax=Chironomus tepperi TaxID=113505 RepID=UPI00391F5285
MDPKLQEVLNRNFDKKMEQTRRSLEAVEIHRKNLIDNELTLLYSALDLKHLIDSLVNDQEVLFKYLCDLKAIQDKTDATNGQIMKIEEDLEVRGAQIIELSSKQENLEGKVKKLSESFTTIPELRTAVVHLLNKLLDSRNDFKTQLTKAEDRIEKLSAEIANLKVPKKTIKKKRSKSIDSYIAEPINDVESSKSIDDLKDPDYSPHLEFNTKKSKVTCKCKRSCLKKFCVCKRSGSYCNNCNCANCLNIEPTPKEGVEKKESSVDLEAVSEMTSEGI